MQEKLRHVEVYGDSILRGIQVSEENSRYTVDNNIDTDTLEKKFKLKIENFSRFGCTITKAFALIEKRLRSNKGSCDAIVMNLGGNDCDHNWKEISERPGEKHEANTPLETFIETYRKLILMLKEKGIRPIITTLPPLDAHKFFNWFCGSLEKKENIISWLGSVETIYRWQEKYSRAIEKLASETGTLLVDLRGAFLNHMKIEPLLCDDGTHPNTEGQKVITEAFIEFIQGAKGKGLISLYA